MVTRQESEIKTYIYVVVVQFTWHGAEPSKVIAWCRVHHTPVVIIDLSNFSW